MQKARYYRVPKPPQKSEKQLEKPKPEWITDFSDPQKYKLSETEMIQRKAALQSKNRELAKQNLEERRRKLEMGIVDEDTRKVYETALTSKKIDLNPSIRRNLSQMIQYEKEKKAQIYNAYQEENEEEPEKQHSDNEFDIETQVKEVQRFIKKLEKAKKQTNIEKAVDILIDDKKSAHFGSNKPSSQNSIGTNKAKFNNNAINSVITSPQIEQKSAKQALSSIEETIKYMQQKLFNPKPKVTTNNLCIPETEEHYQESNLPINIDSHDSFSTVHHNPDKIGSNTIFDDENLFKKSGQGDQSSYNEFIVLEGHRGNGAKLSLEDELDSLKINLGEPSVDAYLKQQDDCMSTIRRMRHMIGEQESFSHNYNSDGHNSNNSRPKENSRPKQNSRKLENKISTLISADDSSGDIQVDFSLTAYEDDDEDCIQNDKCKDKSKPMTKKSSIGQEYEQVKRNLFEEVDKLDNYKISNLEINSSSRGNNAVTTTSFASNLQQQQEQDDDCQSHEYQNELTNPPARKSNNKMKKHIKFANANNQLAELQGMISGNRTNIQKIQIEPMGANRGGMMGFDYRGSINIRKNVSNAKQKN